MARRKCDSFQRAHFNTGLIFFILSMQLYRETIKHLYTVLTPFTSLSPRTVFGSIFEDQELLNILKTYLWTNWIRMVIIQVMANPQYVKTYILQVIVIKYFAERWWISVKYAPDQRCNSTSFVHVFERCFQAPEVARWTSRVRYNTLTQVGSAKAAYMGCHIDLHHI